jgi:PAS domain S-box-containing protein
VNDAQHKMLGLEDGEILGKSIIELHCEKEEAQATLHRLAAGEIVHDHRAAFRHKDGSFRYVLVNANARWDKEQIVHTRWFIRDITMRIELQSELAKVAEREKQRIGAELHDTLGQQLNALSFIANHFTTELEEASSPFHKVASRLCKHIDDCRAIARNLARGLQPVSPEPEGLMRALRELATRTREIYKIRCVFRCPRRVLVSNPIAAGHMFRIAQEAVNNAMKHAQPTRITIGLSVVGNKTVIGVKDNGTGFRPPKDRSRGMGLHIMRHRSDVIDGTLVVQKHPKGGTEVVCTVPELHTRANTEE